MSHKRGVPWGLTLGGILALFFIVVAVFVIGKADKSRSDLPVLGQVPAFEFIERSNQPFGLDQLSGKVNIVDFIFTRCQGACPVMASAMRPLYKAYEGYADIQFVSISVDPEYDTPEILQEYAIRQGVVDNRWVFLNGPIEEVTTLSEKGFMLPADNLPMGHSTRFVLVDQQGRIRGYYDSYSADSMELLKTHIRALYKSES